MKTVLIADDEPNLRLLVSMTIQSDEYNVVQASDGNQAWDLLVQHRPSVALLDVQMPGKTGIDLIRAIRGDPDLAATHVIMLSSQSRPEDIEAGIAAGANLYLTKPFSPLQLLTVVEQAMGLDVDG